MTGDVVEPLSGLLAEVESTPGFQEDLAYQLGVARQVGAASRVMILEGSRLAVEERFGDKVVLRVTFDGDSGPSTLPAMDMVRRVSKGDVPVDVASAAPGAVDEHGVAVLPVAGEILVAIWHDGAGFPAAVLASNLPPAAREARDRLLPQSGRAGRAAVALDKDRLPLVASKLADALGGGLRNWVILSSGAGVVAKAVDRRNITDSVVDGSLERDALRERRAFQTVRLDVNDDGTPVDPEYARVLKYLQVDPERDLRQKGRRPKRVPPVHGAGHRHEHRVTCEVCGGAPEPGPDFAAIVDRAGLSDHERAVVRWRLDNLGLPRAHRTLQSTFATEFNVDVRTVRRWEASAWQKIAAARGTPPA